MKKLSMAALLLCLWMGHSVLLCAQLNLDTLAIQDFEITPASPTWNFTGPVIYNSGYSSASAAAPLNSPLGISGSRAWETTTNSGGLVLDFNNIIIPAGYDSIRVHFNLAAMNLISTGGGPDNLDYVLVAYSLDGGGIFTNRLRIRGAVNDNSYWAYDATGVAKVSYLPATEALFQPTNTGLATTFGYSNCEIVFPGSVTQVQVRITGRSSSSTDTWLIDNLLITGENTCTASASSISVSTCNAYTAPSGAVFTTSGVYQDTILNVTGCDSIIAIDFTLNPSTISTINPVACGSFISPAGNLFTSSGAYTDTIPNVNGCDSIIQINLTINNTTALVTQSGNTLTASSATGTYSWIDCSNSFIVAGETSQSFTPVVNGMFALVLTENGCTDTSACFTVSGLAIHENEIADLSVYPNPTTGFFTIDAGVAQQDLFVEIIDATGRVMVQKNIVAATLVNMDLHDMAAGIYLVRITPLKGEPVYSRIVKK